MGFWLTWILIPIIVEIIPAFISAIVLVQKNRHPEEEPVPMKLPFITIIVPVYNSEDTLYNCLKSIKDSTYPDKLIQVILADNQSTDNSFGEFARAQTDLGLNMQLMKTIKGKANALNASIYQSIGTYIINIDSDGTLEKNALMNVVLKFENHLDISAMTGTILPRKDMIKRTKKFSLKLLRKNEYFEYAQAFLSGRVIESYSDQIFTMSGAFSSFRKSTLMKTFMYDTKTLGEDTEMTFQIRDRLKQKVLICTDAIFYIDPISNLDELYRQRQRWQRGELEVAHSYMRNDSAIKNFFNNFLIRRMMIDHTFIFPKMIWLFASFVLLFLRYSPVILGISYVIIYFLYVLVSTLNYFCVKMLLKKFQNELRFYTRISWVALTLPMYNFICSWFRLIGSLNVSEKNKQWNSLSFDEESKHALKVVKKDIRNLRREKD
ncbi:glycosyltransferase [Companilactobacillus kimchiensis]|uniref:Glycosyltransferase n=2 Tax=Companilactobacillus kimchiensis TaxID=993692 RepID=A0A0R2LP30_9LACO|nr:glycosyltransferase [Companilactobacillus kimchiensis]